MSINVHVSGNPISIKRGKMITLDPNYAKKEFEKRRLIRLQQVREQSKEIAEKVRNRVRKEKERQMRQIEKEGKEKLRNWQNRKLLELQTQYESTLKDIGIGHRQADELQDESENIIAQREINQQISNQRGKEAATKQQLEKSEDAARKNVPLERKKLVREIEKTRSAMVTKFPKPKMSSGEPKVKKKKRKTSADINITIPDLDSDQFSSSSPSEYDSEECRKIESSSPCDCTNESCSSYKSPVVPVEKDSALIGHQRNPPKNWQIPPLGLTTLPENDFTSSSDQKLTDQEKAYQSRHKSPPPVKSTPVEPPRDTRISDRIKRREIMAPHTDYCMRVAETHPIPYIESNTKIREAIDSRLFGRPCSRPTERRPDERLEVDERLDVSPDIRCACGANQKTCHHRCGRIQEQDATVGYIRSSVTENPLDYKDTPSKPSVKLKSVPSKPQEVPSKPPDNVRSSAVQNGYSTQINDTPLDPAVGNRPSMARFQDIPSKPSVRIKSTAGSKGHSSQLSNIPSDPSMVQIDHQFKDIPSKPSIQLKPSTNQSDSQVSKGTDEVQFYDHPNRFSHTKRLPSYVERIPTESVEVIPDVVSEREWLEKIKQRDREAQIRGRIALNKEKVRKDYEELMRKLPLLQKKERINEIFNDKPEYHMSEERLKERERVKQNQLENAFNKMFPDLKPALVTLPKKVPSKESVIPEEEEVRSINVGKWDVDFEEPKIFTAQEVQEIVKAFTGHETNYRRSKLKELLRSLKLQKEELLQELRSLPRDESLDELINDLKSFSDSDDKVVPTVRKRERKRSRDKKDKDTSAESSQEQSEREHDRKYRHAERSSRKKPKVKGSRKVLVLQNISTQTTPKVERKLEEADAKVSGEVCSKIHAACDCNKENEKQSQEELCQIFIRLNDDETPDIVVKTKETQPKLVQSKSVGIGTEESPQVSKKPSPVGSRPSKSVSQSNGTKPKPRTWKEQLSKNSISTTSTSYMSPPDLGKTRGSQKSSLYNLRKKPQQKELSDAFSTFQSGGSSQERHINSKLFDQIQQLLRMARGSVENLNVSSSNVQTPSQSIIEMESNNPKGNIIDMLKDFLLKVPDVAEELSYSTDISPVPYNTSASTTESDFLRKVDSSSMVDPKIMIPEKDGTTSKSAESVTAQFADITDSCSKRIQTLADMIQKLRDEKIQMLHVLPESMTSKPGSPVLSDKDFSTAYMNLPDSKESSKNSGNSVDEEDLYRRLVDIDQSLANKLRQLVVGEKTVNDRGGVGKETSDYGNKNHASSLNTTNEELLMRLKQLQEPPKTKTSTDPPPTSTPPEINNQPFVPFLLDIPKLPKFEIQPPTTQTAHKRPPPSKGLTIVRKFNGNISLTPHELSTIVEADSQLSTKMGSNVPSPNASKTSIDVIGLKDIELIVIPERSELPNSRSDSEREVEKVPQIAVTAQKKEVRTSPKKTQPSPKRRNKSPTHQERSTSSEAVDISKASSTNTTATQSINYCDDSSCAKKSMKKSSSSSSDDIENIEAMLKSIGMEWAIPTLHKTQEALAMTSSSSSLDLTSKKRGLSNDSSVSEVSLKEFMRKQMMSKVSSSTMKTDASPGSLLGEFSDISAIQAANSSTEKEKQRTSTPLMTSKSTSKSKVVFSADSDLSSVRGESLGHSKK
ncbi:uncharacterized protein [Leptinotarsa decemlineata]|uniref:uncharacterized protein n=1 Tax=Leptinotarsa decemlineata TaxID=7539 RepID=UPI003D30C814